MSSLVAMKSAGCWYIVPRALAKRSGKPGRRADGQGGTAAEQRGDPRRGHESGRNEGREATRERAPVPDASDASTKTRLLRAQSAMRSGDFRTARSLATGVAAQGDEREREQARKILASLSPDRAALVAAACVLLVIAFAAIVALFRAH
jgi:hypothetical protein